MPTTEFQTALDTSLETKLWKSGYTWNPNLNRSYLGDVQINVSKVWSGTDPFGENKQLLQPIIVLPTARDQDMTDLYGLKAGDRRFGLGLKYAVEKRLPHSLQLNASVSATYVFSGQHEKRIPSASDDELNEYLDQNTTVSGGNRLQSQLQARYQLPKWVGFNTGVLWQKKTNENLSGTAFSAQAYEMGSSKTGYELFSSYASIDLNSVQSFINGNFLFPAVAEFGVGVPISGRNAIAESTFEFQASMFF